MKLGFYDSGLGGISVLKEFVASYGKDFSYVYFGDSARAPYGNKTKTELLGYIQEIMDYMKSKEVDLVISACNTTSMLINELDLTNYNFKTINLFEVMNDFFSNDKLGKSLKTSQEQIALLATSSNIDSERYKDWGMNIYPVKCPTIVPFVEAGNLEQAKIEWNSYLEQLPTTIKRVIIGCTHYEFLVEKKSNFEFISPAKLSLNYFKKIIASHDGAKRLFKLIKLVKPDEPEELDQLDELRLDMNFTKNLEENLKFAKFLLALNPLG